MKQVILDGKIVTGVNENAEIPVTIGVGVPDETVLSVGQILEDDLTVRDITEQEIVDRFGLFTSVNKGSLYSKLTQSELTSFISASKTNINIEVIKELLDAGGTVDMFQNNILVDENIITEEGKADILGITEKKEFIANGMVIKANTAEIAPYPLEEEEVPVTEEQTETTTPAAE